MDDALKLIYRHIRYFAFNCFHNLPPMEIS
jgi:hypothetical protein